VSVAIPEPELDELYREIILDHYRHPRNKGALAAPGVRAEGYNPLCGDEIIVDLQFEDGVINDIAFDGRGCSISQASGSLMTTAVKGRTVAEARRLMTAFKKMITDTESEPPPELGDLEALQGVGKFAVRVKCATLAWHVLEDGLNGRDGAGQEKGEE
jgi:nitrogen fixation NifU-like protein